jgi:hypothetical protein
MWDFRFISAEDFIRWCKIAMERSLCLIFRCKSIHLTTGCLLSVSNFQWQPCMLTLRQRFNFARSIVRCNFAAITRMAHNYWAITCRARFTRDMCRQRIERSMRARVYMHVPMTWPYWHVTCLAACNLVSAASSDLVLVKAVAMHVWSLSNFAAPHLNNHAIIF